MRGGPVQGWRKAPAAWVLKEGKSVIQKSCEEKIRRPNCHACGSELEPVICGRILRGDGGCDNEAKHIKEASE